MRSISAAAFVALLSLGSVSAFVPAGLGRPSATASAGCANTALQMALDILHQKEDKDLLTGLKARTNPGRPNWDKVFTRVREENKGRVTIFYCGNPHLAKTLKAKCSSFGFNFKKEVF